jgi:hypothetical protein
MEMWGNVGIVLEKCFYLFLSDTAISKQRKGNQGNAGDALGFYVSFVSFYVIAGER